MDGGHFGDRRFVAERAVPVMVVVPVSMIMGFISDEPGHFASLPTVQIGHTLRDTHYNGSYL